MKVDFDSSKAKPWSELSDKEYVEFGRKHAEAFGELHRVVARAWARFCHLAYTKSKNPTYPWSAYHKLRASGEDIPSWVLEYLDKCSKELDTLRQQSPGRINAAVSQALGFAKLGRGTVFSEFDQDLRDFEIAKAVHFRRLAGGAQDHACYFVEQECDLSKSTVLRAYKKFNGVFHE
jgi:hypothetical protein